MPRPDDLTGERLAELEAFAAERIADVPLMVFVRADYAETLEAFVAAGWLAQELLSRGCTGGRAKDLCESSGQITAAYHLAGRYVPWEVAGEILHVFEMGLTIKPGDGLAEKLVGKPLAEFARQPFIGGVVAAMCEFPSFNPGAHDAAPR